MLPVATILTGIKHTATLVSVVKRIFKRKDGK